MQVDGDDQLKEHHAGPWSAMVFFPPPGNVAILPTPRGDPDCLWT
jgi:hypothetical protein